MSAPRLPKLRVRGTHEQRYKRLTKACLRKARGTRRSGTPKLAIDYFGIWRRRYGDFRPNWNDVDITITRTDLDLDLPAGPVGYTDDSIEVLKRAVQHALLTHQGEWFAEPELGIPWTGAQ